MDKKDTLYLMRPLHCSVVSPHERGNTLADGEYRSISFACFPPTPLNATLEIQWLLLQVSQALPSCQYGKDKSLTTDFLLTAKFDVNHYGTLNTVM